MCCASWEFFVHDIETTGKCKKKLNFEKNVQVQLMRFSDIYRNNGKIYICTEIMGKCIDAIFFSGN